MGTIDWAWGARRLAVMLAAASVFLGEYWAVAELTRGRSVDLGTPLDAAIPLVPWTAWLYVPLYVAGIMTTGWLLRDTGLWRRAVAGVAIGQAITTLGYVVLPSAYPRAGAFSGVSWEGMSMGILAFVHTIDPPNNTFPSAHVMVACLCAAFAWKTGRRLKWLVLASAVGVAVSVTTTKQHWVVDSLAGIAVAFVSLRLAARAVEAWEGRAEPWPVEPAPEPLRSEGPGG